MKTISVLVPTYNEQDNIVPLYETIAYVFEQSLPGYAWELVFIDNASTDNTRPFIGMLCQDHENVRAIFNNKNFGVLKSQYYGLCQTTGDCTVMLCADFQEPPEMIPQFVAGWEEGYKVVAGIKASSKESRVMYFFRSIFYYLMKRMSTDNVEQIEHFTGFGLYDKTVIQTMASLNDPLPFLRGIVAELGYKRKDIPYEQQKRRAGKSKYKWYKLFDMAMLGFTSYTKFGLRVATLAGGAFSVLGLVITLVTLVQKLLFWDRYDLGMAPILIGIFLFGSLQLLFIGLLGEYIMNINARIIHRPLVIEERRLNWPAPSSAEASGEGQENKT